jgi:trimeric autotransporter adhesin
MKQIWPDYSYSPATNVLTLTGLNIDRDQLLLVTAADRGRIMYNFADSAVTASAYTAGANTALTLVASTAGLTTTASLVIYYDDQLQSTAITISNFPATQPVSIASVTVGNTVTIAGTVTANPTGTQTIAGTVTANIDQASLASSFENYADSYSSQFPVGIDQTGFGDVPISGTVTIGAGTAQIGSVTASNLTSALEVYDGGNSDISINVKSVGGQTFEQGQTWVPVAISAGSLPAGTNRIGVVTIGAGTVTIGAGTSQIGSVTASISNSVTIASLPAISGTVTANLSISSTVITSGSFSSLSSATLVPGNTARKMATVYNLGAGQLFVNAGVTATTLGGGFMVALSSGDFYECDYTTTTLSAIFATAGTASWMSH